MNEKLAAIALIVMGALLVLAPVISDYHQRTLVADDMPFLWSEANRSGDSGTTNEIMLLEIKMNKGISLGIFYYLVCSVSGAAMIGFGIRLTDAAFKNNAAPNKHGAS